MGDQPRVQVAPQEAAAPQGQHDACADFARIFWGGALPTQAQDTIANAGKQAASGATSTAVDVANRVTNGVRDVGDAIANGVKNTHTYNALKDARQNVGEAYADANKAMAVAAIPLDKAQAHRAHVTAIAGQHADEIVSGKRPVNKSTLGVVAADADSWARAEGKVIAEDIKTFPTAAKGAAKLAFTAYRESLNLYAAEMADTIPIPSVMSLFSSKDRHK
jgi:hypothetical protein